MFRPADMRIEIAKLPATAKTFANVFQLLLNFTTMIIILNFIITIICDVEQTVRTGNRRDDWLKLSSNFSMNCRRKIFETPGYGSHAIAVLNPALLT